MTETNAKIDAKTVNLVDHLFDPNANDMVVCLERQGCRRRVFVPDRCLSVLP